MTSAQEPQAPLPESAEARIYELCLGGGDVDSGLRELQLRHPQHAAALAGLVRDLRRADNMVGGVRELAGSAESPVAPGTTWGNYRIVRELGRGGFGSVYLAEQHEPVRREVALKVVSAAASSPDMLQRFAAERQVLAQLSHPSIARVLDAGTTPAGQPYFAMDFLPGSPIAAFADERRLGVPARLQLFLQVCHAVQHAHQRGVLHRDLKPGNVLVAERDGGLVPCVIDFGLAKVLQQDAAPGAVGTTEFGRLLGTPEYMSPEQAMGEPVDTRTDVYSLGVMLFELLTGELPFSSERLRARGLGTVVQVLANEEPPLPSTALRASATAAVAAHRRSTTVQDLARRLRGDLDGIVHACLQKDREQRYGSVAELAADLQRHLHHEPISVARPGAFYLLGKFARRHRAWFAASVLGGLGLLSGTAAIGWSLVRVTDARDRAIAAADAASRNAYAAAIAAAQSAGDSCRADAMRAHLAGTEPALRNLEWHVLQAQSEDALQVLAAGFDVPHCLVVHGKQATWFDVETSRIRRADLETGQVTEHGEHPWQVVQVVASRDGTRLVTGGTEGRLGVGDAQDLTLHRELRIGSQQVRGIALTPDGAQCLAADDRELVLVEVGTGAELARLRGHESFCWSVDIAPDGMRAASGDQDGKVRIWDLGRRETLHVLQHPVTVRQVSFHPDGSLLATAARDGVIRLWDARDGRLLASQATGAPIVHALAFSPDGSVLASAQSDGSVRAWDATTLLDLGAHRGHSAYVAGVTHAADGTLVTCAWDGTVRTWPARPRARHRYLEGMMGNTMRMALHPSEPVLAACSLGGEVAAWDLRDGRRLFARDLGGGMAHGIAFHPAGDRLYVTSDRGGIHVLDAHRGEQQLALPSRRMRVRDLQFRPGRDQLLVGGSNGEVVLLQASGLEVVQRMQPPPGSTVHNAMRTVVDPEGMVVVGCDPGHALRAWTIDTGTLLWERSADRPLDAGFAPGGALFACTSSGHVVELDPATGGELRRFGRGNPHQPVTHLQVTPDGQRLVTTDQRLRIWDLQAGRELLALDTVRYDPGAVLALPERGVLAAGGGYFTEPAELLLWPLGR